MSDPEGLLDTSAVLALSRLREPSLLPDVALISAVTMPVGTASVPQPSSIMKLEMRRPRSVLGVMSPKPTVVIDAWR